MGRDVRNIPKSKILGVDLLKRRIRCNMILVTLGTQDKEFPRLIQAVEKKIELGKIKN